GAFSVDDVAAELGLSKRTLQRQLSAEALSFKELLDIYRQEQAFLMLQNGQQDLATLAYTLGYNEQSSFNRAFRRWTGKSPSQWLSANYNAA
ncbi:MAG: AraC family transcriptional regulator, partial [Chloroflexota bacterium]